MLLCASPKVHAHQAEYDVMGVLRQVEYEDLPGAVFSIEEAMEANSYIEV